MGFFTRLFNNKKNEDIKAGGMNDYMTLIRVYFQASLAAKVGITNLAVLPDLRTYKQTFKIPTLNNKLGVGEKKSIRKTMKLLYQMDDTFFDEIDNSIKKGCKKIQDVQGYLYQFQAFSQDLMMLVGNLMKFKLRIPSIFNKLIYKMTEKTVTDIFTKNSFTDQGVIKTVMNIRQLNNRLGFSQQWITKFVYQIVVLAKKEPRNNTYSEEK